MPRVPKDEKRTAYVIANAFKVTRFAIGNESDVVPDDGNNKAAQALGKLGGAAQAQSLTVRRRKELAKKAAKSRKRQCSQNLWNIFRNIFLEFCRSLGYEYCQAGDW
jgi:hypothetical protein